MVPSKFQSAVQDKMRQGKSVLLIAPTGVGKTFAVTGDIQDGFRKTIYAVPLRALGEGIRADITSLVRINDPIKAVVHHGDSQESQLFSEEVIVTTYDQVVCGVPGLPLSLPLKAGHAVAAALLMSRLILDEVHLAWGISAQALTILLAILDFRGRLGLQSAVLTATLPSEIAKVIADRLKLDLVVVGDGDLADDEALMARELNRDVTISWLELKTKGTEGAKQLDYTPLHSTLVSSPSKRIYFSNTVERLHQTYDGLIESGIDPGKVTVLHNRMPGAQRAEAEKQVRDRFGKNSPEEDWLLLTNQVAEAGLDISAPLVISDPAPVDTLVQRAGRCARWFRSGKAVGKFSVIAVPKAQQKDWALPYRVGAVGSAISTLPADFPLSWETEREWLDQAWEIELDANGKLPNKSAAKRAERIKTELDNTAFALNLFDRAAQERKPGEIAAAFRDILSVEIAVEDVDSKRDLQGLLDERQRPDTSSVSLRRAWQLLRETAGNARLIRYEEGDLHIVPADRVQSNDILVVPSTVAYLHKVKGLCFGNGSDFTGTQAVALGSEWKITDGWSRIPREGGRRQSLVDHVLAVMEGTRRRLTSNGEYRTTLIKILRSLERDEDAEQLADATAQIATLAAGLHDLGKADQMWQAKAREIDPGSPEYLIGRTLKTSYRIGRPHTPPAYLATLKASELLMGRLGSFEYLVRAIALAAARHHSSLLNPALVRGYHFEPHEHAIDVIRTVLEKVDAPGPVIDRAEEILEAARPSPSTEMVPLLLPNDDLFPIYALVGRAILMADREDASGSELERWEVSV